MYRQSVLYKVHSCRFCKGFNIVRSWPVTHASFPDTEGIFHFAFILQTMQQQQPMMQGTQQTMVMTQQLQPKAVDMMTPQQQKQQVGSGLMMKKGEQSSSSDWSPVTDLSPILDVSPSLEAAEQELMEKCVQVNGVFFFFFNADQNICF